MLILSLLPLFLVTACCAAPSRRANGCLPADLLAQDLPSHQTQLVAPKTSPNFVTISVGNQNSTCTSSGTYTSTGSIAQVFDITSLYPGPLFKNFQGEAYLDWVYNTIKDPLDPGLTKLFAQRYNIPVLGKQYSTEVDGQSAQVWEFRYDRQTKEAIVTAKVTGEIVPSYANIPWQQLTHISGELADTIFRTDTAGGVAPQDCTPGTPDIAVKFVAKDWLYGGDVKTCGN